MTAASMLRAVPDRWARRYGAPLALLLAGAWLWRAFVPPPGLPTLIDLGTFGGQYSQACGMNDRGQVVGWACTADGTRHAFLWERGRMRDLGTLPGCSSAEALAIDGRGRIAGLARRKPPAAPLLFLWESGRMRVMGEAPLYTSALMLNARGEIVGQYAGPPAQRVFIWEPSGVRWLLTHPSRWVYATGLSDSGAVTGCVIDSRQNSHAAVWQDGAWRSLRLGPRCLWSGASGINSSGHVAGTASTGYPSAVAVLWRDGAPRFLDVPGARATGASDIDDRGTVLGSYEPRGRTQEWHLVLWGSRGIVPVRVHRLSPRLRVWGAHLNNGGWICGGIRPPDLSAEHAMVILPPLGGWE